MSFFSRNIDRKGKLLRAVLALVFLAAGIGTYRSSLWLGGSLIGIGLFCAVEALSGWCLLRACGIKTRI